MKKCLFLILFLPTVCFADVLPPDIQTLVLDDFSGGLFTNWPSYKIPLTFTPRMYNVFIDNNKIQTINGFVTVGSSNTLQKVTGIFPFYQETGNTAFVVTDSSVTLDTQDFKSWTFISSGSNTGGVLRCIQVRNKMWCGNGLDSWYTWDRTNKVVLDGTVGTPNVPKFRYPFYWQNRVFGLSTSADGSSLDFSAVTTTDGIKIAPDDSRAWPATNNLSVGRGDGQLGTGVWVENGQLAIGKERSIYKIYGTNPTSYQDRKENPDVGIVSHDSIVILDGLSYFVGPFGIYEGRNRISDHIRPDFEQIIRNTVKTLENSWDSQSDFSKGNFSFGSTATAMGIIQPMFGNVVLTTSVPPAPVGSSITLTNSAGTAVTGTTSTAFGILVSTINPFYFGFTDTLTLWIKTSLQTDGTDCTANPTISIKNQNRNETVSQDFTGISQSGIGQQSFVFKDFSGNVAFGGQDVNQGSYAVKVELRPSGQCKFEFYPATESNKSGISLYPATTVQFTSEVSTLASVTAWGNFDSVRNTNGGQISYFFRTSTSSVNITTQVWTNITPGIRINAPTINNYIQWSSTISSVSTITASQVDKVTIDHVEGAGASNRPVAIDWNNRLWVLVSTESTGNFPRIFVKSRITNKFKDAWMPIQGININCLAKDGSTTLYGGSSSTGVVYRLDYGTNFDGQVIESVYETPNLTMDSYWKNKNILKYLVHGDKQMGANLLVETSVDGGNFTTKTLSIDGSGTYREVLEGVTNTMKDIRIRLRNNQLDKGLSVNSFEILYQTTPVYK